MCKIKAKPCISSIPQGIAYHQLRKKLYIIKPTEIHTFGVMRYKGDNVALDDIHADA